MDKDIGLYMIGTDIPVVSVVMPVYNSDNYLQEAIESILNQTFSNFEFLIIDDGSTDHSIDVIQLFEDPRIRLIRNEHRLGLSNSLNLGLSLARGDYIARMDADDISLPERLEKQIKFMESYPTVGVSGGWIEFFGCDNFILKLPTTSSEIKCSLFFCCSLAHPTVIMRKDLLTKHNLRYNEEFDLAEDYDLWVRCASLFPLANLGEVLVRYRTHSQQIGSINNENQRNKSLEITFNQVKNLGIIPTIQEKILHSVLVGQRELSRDQVKDFDEWLSKLNSSNKKNKIYPVHIFSRKLAERWLKTCFINKKAAIWNIINYGRLHLKWMKEYDWCIFYGMKSRNE